MTEIERFDQNARSHGVLIDTNLFVLLIVGAVNRERVSRYKRTGDYTPADWDLLAALLELIPLRYSTPHVLAEVNTLADLKGPEGIVAREMLGKAISVIEEVSVPSRAACATDTYRRLGLTDAAIAVAAAQRGCSVLTNDAELYVALVEQGACVLRFDHLRSQL